jgi:hypothetical protein
MCLVALAAGVSHCGLVDSFVRLDLLSPPVTRLTPVRRFRASGLKFDLTVAPSVSVSGDTVLDRSRDFEGLSFGGLGQL